MQNILINDFEGAFRNNTFSAVRPNPAKHLFEYPCGLNSLAMCVLTLYPRGDPSDKVSTRSDSACYGHVDSNRLPQSYMVLRSLYGLWRRLNRL